MAFLFQESIHRLMCFPMPGFTSVIAAIMENFQHPGLLRVVCGRRMDMASHSSR